MTLKLLSITSLLILLLNVAAVSQLRDDAGSLSRLRTVLDRTATLLNLLPADIAPGTDLDFGSLLEQAESRYREAEVAFGSGNVLQGRAAVAQAYVFLGQIETLVREHPLLRVKFKEQLDRRIQQAEEVARRQPGPEFTYLIARAKLFRQKAQLFFQEGRTLAAIEYVRLAQHFADQVIKLSKTDRVDSAETDWQSLYSETQSLLAQARLLTNGQVQSLQVSTQLDRIEKQLPEIEELYRQAKYREARQRLLGINRALYRVIDMAEKLKTPSNDQMEVELEKLSQTLTMLSAELPENQSAAKRLYKQATRLNKEAARHLEDDQRPQARQKLSSANELALKLNKMLRSSSVPNAAELKGQYDIALQNLAALKRTSSSTPGSASFIHLIEKNLDMARKAESTDLPLAVRYLRTANSLIRDYYRFHNRQSATSTKIEQVKSELSQLTALIEELNSIETLSATERSTLESATGIHALATSAAAEENWQLCKNLTRTALQLLGKQ